MTVVSLDLDMGLFLDITQDHGNLGNPHICGSGLFSSMVLKMNAFRSKLFEILPFAKDTEPEASMF